MTIFEAKTYDPRRARRRNFIIGGVVALALIIVTLAWFYRNWPEERVVQKFFTALQNKDYEQAYALWQADPNWKQHPQNYPNYSYGEFYQDWGPGGEWGLIRSFRIDGSANPKTGSGVVVVVTVNDRKEKQARVWVENKSKTLTFSPF